MNEKCLKWVFGFGLQILYASKLFPSFPHTLFEIQKMFCS